MLSPLGSCHGGIPLCDFERVTSASPGLLIWKMARRCQLRLSAISRKGKFIVSS